MGEKSREKGSATTVSRKLSGRLRFGDRVVAVKEHDEPQTHVPIPHRHRDFDESLCPEGSGLDLRALDFLESNGELFLLGGDSEAVIERDGRVTLEFVATVRTLEAYHVTLGGLFKFASNLEKKLGYDVEILPAEKPKKSKEQVGREEL